MKNRNDLLIGDNLPFIEDLYAQYVADPTSVDPSWAALFDEYFGSTPNGHASGRVKPHFSPRGLFQTQLQIAGGGGDGDVEYVDDTKEAIRTPQKSVKFAARVGALVRAHRLHGHLISELDPLGRTRRNHPPELEPKTWFFDENDMETPVVYESLFGKKEVTLREVFKRARELYCGTIAVEYQNIPDSEPRQWLRTQIEKHDYAPIDGPEEKKRILQGLVDADAFEMFLHKKYVGAKRFGITGGDALIPTLKALLNEGATLGLEEVVIGMAHRGRLNVLHNLMGKPADAMLSEFEKAPDPEASLGGNDVKYHLGYSSDFEATNGKKIHMSLTFNPSHLEFVNPVVMGRTRAKQDRCGKIECRKRMAPLLLHGDAAFAGQGVVAESLNLASLDAHDVGGTIHVIINNQVGFTANPEESRSTTYCTDIAKILEVPIFHVNADDPEACIRVAKLAIRYRQKFQQDVIIDLVCYRRYGHNEGDEPRFTQPQMYAKIDKLDSVRVLYGRTLVEEGVMTEAEVEKLWTDREAMYESAFQQVKKAPERKPISTLDGVWEEYRGGQVASTAEYVTSVPKGELQELANTIFEIPEGVTPHRTVKRLFGTRLKNVAEEQSIDWGTAENLAFASLVKAGIPIRLCGQDSIRGTFGHRHAAIIDQSGERHWPIRKLSPTGNHFQVFNSLLSECAVLGFEYGYSLDYPDALVIWEAQFGDFSNGAQVIIDQFISSGEDKWKRLSGIVMLLPHGYEGQGPEHSSARLERYLQLCAEDNMFVCNFTTPAQYFHALRRHVLDRIRKPMVVMTPKSLLRLRDAASTVDELANGTFQHIIGDQRDVDPNSIKRVVMCSGKVYYDLLGHAKEHGHDDTAIVRIEQLYPLKAAALVAEIKKYPNCEDLVWAQEEPKNMGPWPYMLGCFADHFDKIPRYVGRVASASPATGLKESHEIEQQMLLRDAFQDE